MPDTDARAKRKQLETQGITDLRQVPYDILTPKQQIIKNHTLRNEVFFDAVGAKRDLASHGLPAKFLDFETIQFPVPIWKGRRPYQQIAFQYSLHILSETGLLSQKEFLDVTGADPSKPFAENLIADCGEEGPIFVYNAAFEKARIAELAERFPQSAKGLNALVERVVDLLPIARNHYYHPAQQGSWSIKAVLPAAIPGLSYEKLVGVKDGAAAMDAYGEASRPGTALERKLEIERQLLAYCRLDTFAMVELWRFFSGRSASPSEEKDGFG